MNSETYHTIALSLIDGLGARLVKNLISYTGGAENVFKASNKDLMAVPQINLKMIDIIRTGSPFAMADKQCNFLEKNNISAYTYTDGGYPQRLKNFEGAPAVIYYQGKGDLNHRRTVGIVGTRSVTPLGIKNCRNLVEALKPLRAQVISGLAYGVDTQAHRAAVEFDMSTIGIMAHGHDRIYPASNKKLAREMLEKGGLLTEFPIDQTMDPRRFPARNRIIAMMSDAVVVVESGIKGGSIITANFANDFNKDVFAFPGRVEDKMSAGCNRLIKIHKANLIEDAHDIAYIMRWEEDEDAQPIQRALFVELDAMEQQVVNLLKNDSQLTVDDLTFQLKVSPSQLASVLINLEFKGVLTSLPGKKFMLI